MKSRQSAAGEDEADMGAMVSGVFLTDDKGP